VNHNELYTLLIRYIDGETTAEEAAVMEDLVLNDAYWKSEFEVLTSLNSKISELPDYSVNVNTEANWQALKSQIEQPAKTKTFTIWSSFAKYAAAAVVIFVAGWFLLKPSKNEFTAFTNGKFYSTGAKETLTVKLDDGTKITLNQNSSLSIDKNFNSNARLVELDGEAYFDVAKNPEKPFITKSKNTYTKVLGTSFEIESTIENQVSVSLYEGKVQFTAQNEKSIITPGEKLIYSLKNKKFEKIKPKTLDKDIWVAGLSFKDAKLKEIVSKLEAQYKVSISVPEDKNNEQYTASFEGLDLLASLHLLEELTDSKITKKGTDYILNP
jgi:transmembrane sensor